MKLSEFRVPVQERYFEDYEANCTYDCGRRTVTEYEIIEFAQRYDAQSFHTDPLEARRSIYGGLIASGWHTVSMTTESPALRLRLSLPMPADWVWTR